MSQALTPAEPVVHEQEEAVQGAAQQKEAKRRFPRQGEWTYEDWLELPNDGWKYEIIDGVLYMSPPPLIVHQRLSIRISTLMHTYAERNQLGVVLTAPCGVRLPGQPIPFEPDILFVKRERLAIVGERYVEGAPNLIVEILSPSNAAYDVETKFQVYQDAGVPEYWLVNPWEKTVTIHHLVNGVYTSAGQYGVEERVTSHELTGFTLSMQSLFDL
jgi:Uma2 family endonuclease